MNKIKSFLYIACAMLLFAGCTDQFVDLEPDDKTTPDIIYSTLTGIESSLVGLYNQARVYATWEDGCEYKYGASDLETAGTNFRDDINYNLVYRLTSFDSQNTFIKNLWDNNYVGLHKCNTAISSLDNIIINENDAERIARRDAVVGVLYFFRAYFHLNLVQRWDNIVMADHVFDPVEEIKLAPKSDIYDLIIADLLKAIETLPEATSITDDRGHITKGVARLVLAKAYMDVKDYTNAAAMAKAVCEDPAYRLVELDEVFSVQHQDNDEIILSWQFTYNEGSSTAQRLTNRFLPLYDRLQGVKRSFKYGGRPYARFIPSDYYWTLFESTDKRLEAWHTLYYIYDTSNTTDEALPPGVVLGDTVKADNFITTNGFGVEAWAKTTKKHHEDGSLGRGIGSAEGWRNIIQYRLGEAYIIAAEAFYRAGDIPSGLIYINALRRRAGVGEFTTITDDIILDEHAREMGMEYGRFEMLKRLGIALQRIQAYNVEVGPAMQAYHLSWPIPYGFQKMTKVPQNEGYN